MLSFFLRFPNIGLLYKPLGVVSVNVSCLKDFLNPIRNISAVSAARIFSGMMFQHLAVRGIKEYLGASVRDRKCVIGRFDSLDLIEIAV